MGFLELDVGVSLRDSPLQLFSDNDHLATFESISIRSLTTDRRANGAWSRRQTLPDRVERASVSCPPGTWRSGGERRYFPDGVCWSCRRRMSKCSATFFWISSMLMEKRLPHGALAEQSSTTSRVNFCGQRSVRGDANQGPSSRRMLVRIRLARNDDVLRQFDAERLSSSAEWRRVFNIGRCSQ